MRKKLHFNKLRHSSVVHIIFKLIFIECGVDIGFVNKIANDFTYVKLMYDSIVDSNEMVLSITFY